MILWNVITGFTSTTEAAETAKKMILRIAYLSKKVVRRSPDLPDW